MPFVAPVHPKCPKCGKSVYAAEEMSAGGYKWHKFCFKCTMCNKMLDSFSCAEHGAELFCRQCHVRRYDMCNKMLDSVTVAPHEAELYCKQCHGRKYGPKGVGFGLGAGALAMDDGSRFNK